MLSYLLSQFLIKSQPVQPQKVLREMFVLTSWKTWQQNFLIV